MKAENNPIEITKWQLFWRKLWNAVNISYIVMGSILCFLFYVEIYLCSTYNLIDIKFLLFMLLLATVTLLYCLIVFICNVIPDFIDYWFTGWKQCKKS